MRKRDRESERERERERERGKEREREREREEERGRGRERTRQICIYFMIWFRSTFIQLAKCIARKYVELTKLTKLTY